MKRSVRRRPPFWPWVSVLVASLGVLGAIALEVWPWTAEISLAHPRRNTAPPPSARTAEEILRVRLFFPQEAKGNLIEEERDIASGPEFSDRVRAVLGELTKVRGSEVRSPLPTGAELRRVFLDAFGILYLEFNKSIQALAGGDGIRTDLAASSLVLTLTTNFSEVKRVQFLSEGEELTLLTGGVDFRHPLQPRFPDEAGQPVGSHPPEAE